MNKLLYWTFQLYFITHIPITLCVDLQALLGSFYPPLLRDLYTWYVTTFQDELMANPPPWLKTFIFLELTFQLPFFFVAVYALYNKLTWIRIPSIVYGIHVATTVCPILTSILASESTSVHDKTLLCSFYLPYLLVPLILAIFMILNENPFSKSQSNKKLS
eukprot:gene27923-36785_t